MAIETTTISANGLRFIADVSTSPAQRGELVVFLHGFPHTRHTWRTELAALDGLGYRVAAFDQRGYSPNARPNGIEAYRVEHLVADACAVANACTMRADAVNQTGTDHPIFHLVGHDWGGQLGWIIAALYPERLHSLSVISRPHPAAFARALNDDPTQAERSKHHRRFQRPEATGECLANDAAFLRSLLADWGAGPGDIEAYLGTLGSQGALDAAINWYRAMGASTPQPADVPLVSVPTLYVWGDADASVGRVAAEGTADFVSGPYQFVEVPNGRHCITDQSPGLFGELLIDHLRANAAPN